MLSRLGDISLLACLASRRQWQRIERALKAATGVSGVTVLGYAGDYSGYYTTEEEYRAQHYEGASTLYGRNATRHVCARLEELATGPVPAPIKAELVSFHTGPQVKNFSATSSGGGRRQAQPRVTRKGRRVEVRWQMPTNVRRVARRANFPGFIVRLPTV